MEYRMPGSLPSPEAGEFERIAADLRAWLARLAALHTLLTDDSCGHESALVRPHLDANARLTGELRGKYVMPKGSAVRVTPSEQLEGLPLVRFHGWSGWIRPEEQMAFSHTNPLAGGKLIEAATHPNNGLLSEKRWLQEDPDADQEMGILVTVRSPGWYVQPSSGHGAGWGEGEHAGIGLAIPGHQLSMVTFEVESANAVFQQ